MSRDPRPSVGKDPRPSAGAEARHGPAAETRQGSGAEARAFLGVGSNIEPEKNVSAALEILSTMPGVTLEAISTFYRTAPLPGHSGAEGADFLNGVVEIQTGMDANQLETSLREVEQRLGRVRTGNPYGPRTLDLDLLIFLPNSFPPSAAGSLPARGGSRPVHPDVTRRPFVALPLLELAPELVLPPDGPSLRSVAEGFDGPGGEAQTAFTLLLRAHFLP